MAYPFKVLVKELADRYNAPRIDDLSNRVVGTFESEHVVRMLIEEIEPLAKRCVDLAFRALFRGSEADRCSLAVRFVDVRDKAPIFVSQLRRFRFAGHSESPRNAASLRITLSEFAAEWAGSEDIWRERPRADEARWPIIGAVTSAVRAY